MGTRRVTTLPERAFFAIRAAWREIDDGRPYLLLQTTSVGRPSRTHRRASMPPVRAVGRPHCKPPRVCSSSSGSHRIGGISVALTTSPLPLCRGAMTRPGPLSWPGWEKPAIRSWLPACTATTGAGGPESPYGVYFRESGNSYLFGRRLPALIRSVHLRQGPGVSFTHSCDTGGSRTGGSCSAR